MLEAMHWFSTKTPKSVRHLCFDVRRGCSYGWIAGLALSSLAVYLVLQASFEARPVETRYPCSEVVVSVSTIAPRFGVFVSKVLPHIEKMLSVDKILVHVQTNVGRIHAIEHGLDWRNVSRGPKTSFYRHEKEDLGPISKLMRALELVTDGDACVVTLDDDVIYRDHRRVFVLKSLAETYADAAVGYGCEEAPSYLWAWQHVCPGCIFWTSKTYRGAGPATAPQACDGWLLGWEGVVYRRKFFHSDLRPHPECYLTDDVMISGYLRGRSIPRLVYAGLPNPEHLPKNENNALSLIPNVMVEHQWPCVRELFS